MLPGVERGDPPSLHRARIASRRLRELLPVLQIQPDRARKLGRRLRKVTDRLGAVRELDVLILVIDELHVSRRFQTAVLSRVRRTITRSRDQARRRLNNRLPIDDLWRIAKRLRRVVDDLDEAEESSSSARAWRWAVDARIARRAGRLHAAVEEAGAMYLPERLHVVRVALKKLRYALELGAEIDGRGVSADIRALKRVQEVLGRMHDLQELIERVRQTQASLAPPNVAVWRDLDALVAALEDDCRRLHARYMRARPSVLAVAEKVIVTEKLIARRKGNGAFPRSTRRVG
jgi:CHAD domain-containing protein